MTDALTPTESLRACGVLEEALEKLGFLGSITPDILQHREELSQIVGEEIARIIQDQRQLEAQYEQLVAQRAVLKGLSNKAQFKENQREIQDVSRKLRDSTKSLCRSLKENPNFAGNLVKIQQEREALMALISQTMQELGKHGTFASLRQFVMDGKNAQERAHAILQQERDAVEDVKRLSAELQREKNEHQKEVCDRKATILQLKEQLVALKAKTQLDVRYARTEAKAKKASSARLYRQLVDEQQGKIDELDAKCKLETRVHEESVLFLKTRQDQLAADVAEWTAKYQHDVQAKQHQLQALQQQKAANASRLESFQKRWQDEMVAIQRKEEEHKRLLELEALKKEELKAQNTAARIIQVSYRQFHARKEEEKKAAAASKKGKKGGKKKGKK